MSYVQLMYSVRHSITDIMYTVSLKRTCIFNLAILSQLL